MELDSRTVAILTAVGTALMGLAMLLASRSYQGRQTGGMRSWAWACGAQSLAWVLFASRGRIPDFLSIVVANTTFVVAGVIFYRAVAEFSEKPLHGWFPGVLVPITFFGFIVLTYGVPNIAARLALVSVCLVIVTFACAKLLLLDDQTHKPLSHWLTGAGFLLTGVAVIVRAGLLLTSDPALSAQFGRIPIQSLMFSACYVSIILMTFGFVLMRIDKVQAELLKLATFDSLTGCLNRAAVERRLKSEIDSARNRKSSLSIMMVDIDRFKTINDSLGHAAGDAAIRFVSQRLQQQLRGSDVIGRFGGDEFIILLPNISATQALIAADRICASIERSQFDAEQDRGSLTVSIGVAELRKGEDEDSLLRRADDALYRAKGNGRNRVEADLIPSENSQAVPSA